MRDVARRRIGILACVSMLVLVCASASQAQTPLRQTEWLVRNMTRVET
jgi:hypothetical protein